MQRGPFGLQDFGQCAVPALPAGVRYTACAAGCDHTVLLRDDGGAVVFGDREIVLEEGIGEATTTATFSEAGDYVLRVRVDNWAANDSSSGDQCCWTNGYVPVSVSGGGMR